MPARDNYHQETLTALEKEGWLITHDPYPIRLLNTKGGIDLGAEKVLAAEKGTKKIAVEIKTFGGLSWIYDFHLAVGQFMNYRWALKKVEADRHLYVGITKEVYEAHFDKEEVREILKEYKLPLIVVDTDKCEIVFWIELIDE